MSFRTSGDTWLLNCDWSSPKFNDERPNVEQTGTTGTIYLWISMTRAPFIVWFYF